MNKFSETILNELLRNKGGTLFHREGQELEFKEQFSLSGLADYFRDFAAFANNKGGYLIFGVKDSPRVKAGLSQSSLDQFEKIDPQKISGYLLDAFSTDIKWQQTTHVIKGMSFGVFYITESEVKPVIAKRDLGKDNTITNGEIYYRYGGRTQRIQFAELENIINKRSEYNNKNWIDLFEKIGKAGPQNAAILDIKRGNIKKGNNQILVVDEALISQMSFIKEGEFDEKKGAKTLKLVGNVSSIDTIEVIKRVKENLLREFPFTAKQIINAVKKKLPQIKEHQIYAAIKSQNLKSNKDYSAYNFRSKEHEDEFIVGGKVAVSTPSIYNDKAIDFIYNILKRALNDKK